MQKILSSQFIFWIYNPKPNIPNGESILKEKKIKSLKKYSMEFFIVLFSSILLFLVFSIFIAKEEKLSIPEKISDSAILKAVIIDYHENKAYPGPPQDFFLDITKFLASRMWAKLEVTHVSSIIEAEKLIKEKKADILIHANPMTASRSSELLSTTPYIAASWKLVVNRDNLKINKIEDIDGGEIVVTELNPQIPYLRELEKKNKFRLVVRNDLSVKDIFSKIESGEILATITDNLTARAMRYFHPKAVTADGIGKKISLSYGIHPHAYDLRFRINLFLKNVCREDITEIFMTHYFHQLDVFEYLDIRKFHRRIKERLPKYLKTIKKHSKDQNLDWRLVAAQIYQESHYDKWARSRAGARGLMQLIPSTARSLGVSKIYSPEQNIRAGIIHLKALYNFYEKAEHYDRLRIALATYNIGQGHMYDARVIAREMGLSPDKWVNMVRILPLLKKKKYYKKALYGYARGDEPVTYVRKITAFYRVLKNLFPEDAPGKTEETSEKKTIEKKD